MTRFLCGLVAVLFVVSQIVRADDFRPYAIVSPTVAAKLSALVDTEDAKKIIADARAELKSQPGPIPVLHTEGTLPHQGIWNQSIKARKDLDTMLNFSLAWRLTGDSAFAKADERFFSAWLATYRISFNPIDETNFDKFLIAYDLAGAKFSPATQAKMKEFLRTMARGYLDAIARLTKHVNNWHSHRVKLAVLASFALGDPALIEQAHQAYLGQLARNIHPDGTVDDFYERDALHYVTYDLEPLCVAALAAKAHGRDWFNEVSERKSSLPVALDWLEPFAMGQKTHVEFVNSKIKFDADRAAAGVPGFAGQWDPAHSVALYELAAILDPKYRPVFAKVSADPGAKTSAWLRLLARAGL
jgi:hypothetical protein